MNKSVRFLMGLAVTAFALAALPGIAVGQQKAGTLKEQIVGTWMLVSVFDQFQDGKKDNPWGPDVKGSATYDSGGRFSYMIISAGRAKSEANPRVPVGQAIGYFGTYSVNEAEKSVAWRIERSTFPNFEGIERKGTVTINGDQLLQVSSPISSPAGSFVPNIEWKRAK